MLDELGWRTGGVRAALSGVVDAGAALVAKAIGGSVPDLAHPVPTMRLVELPPSVRIDDKVAEEALRVRIASDAGAELNVSMHAGRSFLRLSAHAYNSARDYELLAARLPALF